MESKIFIYQVLPRWFGNVNSTNKENGTKDENGVGKLSAFTDKALKEIKKMGFTHIWYTGVLEHATKTDYSAYAIAKDHPDVVKGNAGSPYAIKDYYDIDPDLADDVENRVHEFEDLIARTHRNGMKVIIDFVPNHTARQYVSDAKPKGFKDFGEEDDISVSFSADNSYYYMPNENIELLFGRQEGDNAYCEFPAKATGNNRFDNKPSINDWYETAKLNYGIDYCNGHSSHFMPTPEVWIKMRDMLTYWAEKGVDGFRCDMAEMVPVEFWNWVIPKVKAKNKNILFVAEVYDPNQYYNYVHAGLFDYLYDKVDLYDTLRDIVCGHKPTSEITFCWQRINGLEKKMLNFLENHDEQRIASDFFAQNPEKALPAMVVSATLNTNPVMVYAGQELGERGMDKEGFSGKDGRTTIFDYWSVESIRNWYNEGRFGTGLLTKEQVKIRKYYIQLIQLCNEEKAISEGIFYDLMYANYDNRDFDSTKQFAFLRVHKKEVLLIIANFSEKKASLKVEIPQEAFNYLKIDRLKIKSATELFSKKEFSLVNMTEKLVKTEIKGYSSQIIKFSMS